MNTTIYNEARKITLSEQDSSAIKELAIIPNLFVSDNTGSFVFSNKYMASVIYHNSSGTRYLYRFNDSQSFDNFRQYITFGGTSSFGSWFNNFKANHLTHITSVTL